MANSKINTVNVGGVDFQIQAASGSSDSGFVDDTIEAALKNLIDSFSVDGTYTGRFKATNTPNKWFSYQIDLFDNIASGYIVNTIDPEESYTVRYRRQTDEQATISSIGKTIAEHEDAISQINNDLSDLSFIISKNGNTWYRIQNDNGTLNIWKSTDGGQSWAIDDTFVSKSQMSFEYVGYTSAYNNPVSFPSNIQDVYLEVNFTYLGASAIVNTLIPKAVLDSYGAIGRNIILGCGTTSQADRCSISLFVTSSSAQINYINVNGVEVGGNLNVYAQKY